MLDYLILKCHFEMLISISVTIQNKKNSKFSYSVNITRVIIKYFYSINEMRGAIIGDCFVRN